MFTRLRRGNLILAAIALVGILAGWALTIASRLGIAEPIVICIGVMAAVAGAVWLMAQIVKIGGDS